MQYRRNVTAVATKLGITNDPGLREEDLTVAKLHFQNPSGESKMIDGHRMNQGGRLLFQFLVEQKDGESSTTYACGEPFRVMAARYFSELWQEVPVLGERPLVDAVRKYLSVDVYWKNPS